MMGRLSGQEPLFFGFWLDNHVPADHLLRRVDAALDFGFVRRALAPYYSFTGRPSVDPELMLRMLLIGYPSRQTASARVNGKASCTRRGSDYPCTRLADLTSSS